MEHIGLPAAGAGTSQSMGAMSHGGHAPVFIVGAPRSGTTLLAAMLASHSQFAAGPETQFFSKLSWNQLKLATRDSDWPNHAIALLSSLTLADQSVISLFESDEQAVRSYLKTRETSISAMLESLTAPFAAKRSKARWVEKTPNHILNLTAIRALWPDACVIRIVRDPRDVGLSTCKLPSFSNRILPNIYLWREWNETAELFLDQDPLAMTIRYEDLVDNAEAQLTDICELLGERFDPSMLTFGKSAADVSSANESWKAQVSDGLSSNRKFAWKRDLPPELRTTCDLICHELLERHGYESGEPPRSTRMAYRMSDQYIEAQEAALVKSAENGERWLRTNDPKNADRIVDHPRYSSFRSPPMLGKLVLGNLQAWLERKTA